MNARLSLLPARLRRGLLQIAGAFAIALPCAALAVPPAHAPAHGWRKKNDPHYAGYSGRQYVVDYGITQGRCDHEAIAAAVGAIAGGAIAAATVDGKDRTVAIVAGTVLGAVLGSEVGRRMDKADRACAGQALELAGPEQTIAWTNSKTRINYKLTPLQAKHDVTVASDGCRRFRLVAVDNAGLAEGRTTACIGEDGAWRLAPEIQLSRR
jgi:surface antigen